MNTTQLEKIILSSLLNDGDYSRKVIPYVKGEFFSTTEATVLTNIILNYSNEYNTMPTEATLEVELDNQKALSTEIYTNAKVLINSIFKPDVVDAIKKLDQVWRLDKTEKYFKQQSCYIAVMNSINILEGEDKKNTPEAIPGILEEALNIHFDNDVGHDYFEDADERFKYYHSTEEKIPFLLNALNNVTNGGASKKALIVPVAPTGVGKSFFMTAWSAFLIKLGYNVLYVTLEMAEEKIAERIDANLMDIAINDLKTIPEDVFGNKISALRGTHLGVLKIKEYPSSSFTANTLKALLSELKSKNNFEPAVIMVDYLNLVSSFRVAKSNDTYTGVKFASEELRSIAMETNSLIVAPTQTNREGVGSADYTLTEISESMGIAHTADFIFGLIETTELANNSQLRIKQLKNRWGDINRPPSFVVSVNKAKMQIHDYDDISEAQVHVPKVNKPVDNQAALDTIRNLPQFGKQKGTIPLDLSDMTW